jgi:hypothetical protein
VYVHRWRTPSRRRLRRYERYRFSVWPAVGLAGCPNRANQLLVDQPAVNSGVMLCDMRFRRGAAANLRCRGGVQGLRAFPILHGQYPIFFISNLQECAVSFFL